MEDKELLRLLQKDSERGLEAALDLYGGLVKTIVSRVLYDSPQDAEECVADVFLRLWKNRRKLHGAPVRAWLVVAARNAAIDRWRKLSRSLDVPLTEEITAKTAAPEEEICELIDTMPPPDREIFIRKYYFLETAAEIAAEMGRTPDDVNARLSRGRKKLRAQLLEGGKHFEKAKTLQSDCKN